MLACTPAQSVRTLTLLISSLALTQPLAAGFIIEGEPNSTLATAQSVDAALTTEAQGFIEDSTTLPHATVIGTGDGTYDYYSFTVNSPGAEGIFDIDLGFFDAALFLFSPSGALITMNDTMAGPVDSGSFLIRDPFIRHTFAQAGVYTVGVAQTGATAVDGGISGPAPPSGAFYLLNISVEDTAVPEPGTLILFSAGMAGLMYRERRKRAAARAAGHTDPTA